MLSVHRVRQGFVEERTAAINRVRGMLSEFGIVLPLQSATVRRQAAAHLDRLPPWAQRAVSDLLAHLRLLDERIDEYDRHLATLAHDDARARRLMALRGIGPIGASAIVATVGGAHEFDSGRQFAAWLGMVPRQYSSGGKMRLGRTLILAFRAEYLARAATKPVLVLCYANGIASRLEAAMEERGGTNRVQVCTFHAWCFRMLRTYGIPAPSEKEIPEYEPGWRRACDA